MKRRQKQERRGDDARYWNIKMSLMTKKGNDFQSINFILYLASLLTQSEKDGEDGRMLDVFYFYFYPYYCRHFYRSTVHCRICTLESTSQNINNINIQRCRFPLSTRPVFCLDIRRRLQQPTTTKKEGHQIISQATLITIQYVRRLLSVAKVHVWN